MIQLWSTKALLGWWLGVAGVLGNIHQHQDLNRAQHLFSALCKGFIFYNSILCSLLIANERMRSKHLNWLHAPLLSIQVCCCPLKTFCLPLATTPPLSYNPPRPPLSLNPVIFVENYTITKFLSLPWDNILVIAAAQELGQNQETSSAPVHHWSHFDMQIKQMQAFWPSL